MTERAPELTVDFLREKEAMYRRMATQYHDMHFAAKGAADAIMLMLNELNEAAAAAAEATAAETAAADIGDAGTRGLAP